MTARILIVDDTPSHSRVIEAWLAAEYYQIATAQDGLEAVRLAQAWQPDVILLDALMPLLDGFAACRRLRSDPLTQHIPVIMISALQAPAERLEALEAGADDVLAKPVDPRALLVRLRSLVPIKRQLDELRARGEAARSLGLSGEALLSPGVAGARALVIDDQDLSAQTLQDCLSHEGILPGRAAHEMDVMALTAAIPFDLVVLSLAMASDDPLRIAARLRAADITHDVPLLLVADAADRPRVLRGFDLGANDCLFLPVDDGELRARARNLVRRKFYRDQLRADLGSALEMALTDPLTGFYNQRYLMRHLRGLLAGGSPNGIAVMMVDVDHFKSINDRFGHSAGDLALKTIADTLRNRTRVFDSIARYGGEEFVVVMPGAGAEDAMSAAERLRASIERMHFAPEPGATAPLTVSIGVSYTGSQSMTPELLLQSADQAMYQAKRGGRNRVEMALPGVSEPA
jgi:two-component system cell cycle response regulator